MVLTNSVKILTAQKLNAETAVPPDYFGFGTGTTAPSRSDSQLTAALTARVSVVDSGAELGVGFFEGSITPADTNTHGTIKEVGVFDTLSGGSMYSRHVHGGVSSGTTKTVRVRQFFATTPESNNSSSVITDDFINVLSQWFAGLGTTPRLGSYVAYGSLYRIDQTDATTGWTASATATPVVLDSTNFVEGLGSLQMGKTGTGTAFSYSKTASVSVPAASYSNLRLNIRVNDEATRATLATSALKIRIGTSSSSYKQYTVRSDGLITGWQLFDLPFTDFEDVGGPTMTNANYIALQWETTSAATTISNSNKLWMDYWALWKPITATQTSLMQEITRPALTPSRSRTNERVRYQTTVDQSVGNTYQYDEFGVFDASSGGNPLVISRIPRTQKTSNVLITHDTTITTNIEDS